LTAPVRIELPGRGVDDVLAALRRVATPRWALGAPLRLRCRSAADIRAHGRDSRSDSPPGFRGAVRAVPGGAVLEGTARASRAGRLWPTTYAVLTLFTAATAVVCAVTGQWTGTAVLGVGAVAFAVITALLRVGRRPAFARGVAELERALRQLLDAPAAPPLPGARDGLPPRLSPPVPLVDVLAATPPPARQPLTSIRPQWARDEREGWELHSVDRFTVRYAEPERGIDVPVEPGLDPAGRPLERLYVDELSWHSDDGRSAPVLPDELSLVLPRLVAGLRVLGVEPVVNGVPTD
jgi:hypothetical protein